jgi:hypothetical protein
MILERILSNTFYLAHSQVVAEHVAKQLLNPDELDFLGDGLARYYQHVLSLFEKMKAHTFVCDFAELALQALTSAEKEVYTLPFPPSI